MFKHDTDHGYRKVMVKENSSCVFISCQFTICVAKTKALISCEVTAQLICAFVFAYAKIRFSHDEAHIVELGFMGIYIFSLKHI